MEQFLLISWIQVPNELNFNRIQDKVIRTEIKYTKIWSKLWNINISGIKSDHWLNWTAAEIYLHWVKLDHSIFEQVVECLRVNIVWHLSLFVFVLNKEINNTYRESLAQTQTGVKNMLEQQHIWELNALPLLYSLLLFKKKKREKTIKFNQFKKN